MATHALRSRRHTVSRASGCRLSNRMTGTSTYHRLMVLGAKRCQSMSMACTEPVTYSKHFGVPCIYRALCRTATVEEGAEFATWGEGNLLLQPSGGGALITPSGCDDLNDVIALRVPYSFERPPSPPASTYVRYVCSFMLVRT